MRIAAAATVLLLTCSSPLDAQTAPAVQSRTPNTISLPADAPRPKATLADVAWMAGGVWRGDGLGGMSEEQWAAPAGGAMIGMFRLIKKGADGADAIGFYEFLTMVEEQGTVVMKLKHFNADLTGWEEKDKFVTFRLSRVSAESVQFDGLTFRRDGADRMTIFLALRDSKTGTVSEAVFNMRRGS